MENKKIYRVSISPVGKAIIVYGVVKETPKRVYVKRINKNHEIFISKDIISTSTHGVKIISGTLNDQFIGFTYNKDLIITLVNCVTNKLIDRLETRVIRVNAMLRKAQKKDHIKIDGNDHYFSDIEKIILNGDA